MTFAKAYSKYSLSRECDELNGEVVDSDGKIDVTDVIAAQDAKNEVNEINAVVEEANECIEQGTEVIDELDDLKDQNAETIEKINSGEVSEIEAKDAVVAAQEAFSVKLSKLGMSREDFNIRKQRWARESDEVEPELPPVEELAELNNDIEIAQEGIGDNVKAFFNRFKKNTKDMKNSGTALVNHYKDEILGLIGKLKSNESPINENADAAKIYNISPIFIAGNENKFDVNFISKFVSESNLKSEVISKNMDKLQEFKSLKASGETFEKMKQLSIDLTKELKSDFNKGSASKLYDLIRKDSKETDDTFVGVLAVVGGKYDIALLKNSMPSWTSQLALWFSGTLAVPLFRKFFMKYAHNIQSEKRKFNVELPAEGIKFPNTVSDVEKQLKQLVNLCNGYSAYFDKLSENYTRCVNEMAKVGLISDNQPLPLLNAELVGLNNQYIGAIGNSVSIFNQIIK